eukprot:3244901-Amphidinium_carterae.1
MSQLLRHTAWRRQMKLLHASNACSAAVSIGASACNAECTAYGYGRAADAVLTSMCCLLACRIIEAGGALLVREVPRSILPAYASCT